MMNGKWQWDDVRFFLAVSREGSLSGAARALGVDHVTVGRRVALLEKQLSAKLLNRTPDGLITTSAGQVILRECEAMEGAALSLERLVSGQDISSYTGAPGWFGPLYMGESIEGAQISMLATNPFVRLKATAAGLGISE